MLLRLHRIDIVVTFSPVLHDVIVVVSIPLAIQNELRMEGVLYHYGFLANAIFLAEVNAALQYVNGELKRLQKFINILDVCALGVQSFVANVNFNRE